MVSASSGINPVRRSETSLKSTLDSLTNWVAFSSLFGNELGPELQLNEVPHNPAHKVSFLVDPADGPRQLQVEISQYAVACALLVRPAVFGGESGNDHTALADLDLEARGAVILC